MKIFFIMLIFFMLNIFFMLYYLFFLNKNLLNSSFSSMYECGYMNLTYSRFFFSMYNFIYLVLFLILDLEIFFISLMIYFNSNFIFMMNMFIYFLIFMLIYEWVNLNLDWFKE